MMQKGEKMMKRIKIKRNTLGDTRTATRVPTFYEMVDSNRSHVEDVSKMMDRIAEMMRKTGLDHDFTKRNDPEKSLFYRELCATIEGKIDSFIDGEWYPMHCKTERHHLNEYCPDDVNLIDVLEMVCDCVCAGLARSGSVRPVKIDADILKRAVDNTVNMLVEIADVED
jgi:hypothetical protein